MKADASTRLNTKLLDLAKGLEDDEREILHEIVFLVELAMLSQETEMSFRLQYLQLQSQMQEENGEYMAVSRIMKTTHDTVKNSISNIR